MRATQICKCRFFVLHLFEAKVCGSEPRTAGSRSRWQQIKKTKMERYVRILRLYHLLIVITFLLPFMVIRCGGPSDEEIEAQRIADSARLADSLNGNNSIDSLNLIRLKQDSTNVLINDSVKQDSSCIQKANNSDSLDNENPIIKKIVKIFLINEDRYTGLGIVYLGIVIYRDLIGFVNAFLLILLSSILISNKKWRNFKTILIIDLIGFVFLNLTINKHLLWGFGICYTLWIGLIIFDAIIYKKNKKSAANNGS